MPYYVIRRIISHTLYADVGITQTYMYTFPTKYEIDTVNVGD